MLCGLLYRLQYKTGYYSNNLVQQQNITVVTLDNIHQFDYFNGRINILINYEAQLINKSRVVDNNMWKEMLLKRSCLSKSYEV